MGPEGHFPLIAFGDLDKVVHVLEVDFGIYPGLPWCI